MEAVGLSSRRESIFLLHFVLSLVVKTKSWFDEGNEFLERKLAEWASYRTPKQRTVVLAGPEDLEARIIPNVDLWIGPAGGDFSAANNWWINGQPGWPQDGDTLQFGGSVLAVQGANTSAVDDLPGLLSPAQVVISSNYNQTITLNNSLDVTGSMTIPSGSGVTIDGAGSLSFTGQTFNWGGGTISTNVLFGAMGGGTMTINGSDVTLNAILTNNGTLNWSSANPQQGAGPNINLGANGRIRNLGTFNIQTDSTEKITGQVDNSGTMQKTGVNTTTITGDFTNSGNLTVNSGTLNFGGLVIDSANMVLNGGNISAANDVEVQNGATLSGVGTITVPVGKAVINDGTVTPGVNSVPGMLSIVGTYTQMSDGVLIINIDSTGNIGVLNVQGRANLDGTLTVNRNQDYQPPVGTDLVFMRYSSVFGDFAMIGIGFNYWENGGPVQYDPTRLNTDYELDAVYM